MPELAKGLYAGVSADMVQALLDDFLDDKGDRAEEFLENLESASLLDLRRFAFECRGGAQTMNQPVLGAISHRFFNYLEGASEMDPRTSKDIERYLDAITSAVSGELKDPSKIAAFVKDLPARLGAEGDEKLEFQETEVMLVMLQNAQSRIIEAEMKACGYRVNVVTSTFHAFEQAVIARPDMIMISAVMDGLGGVDLAIALKAMPATRNISIAVLTSLAEDNAQISLLPKGVSVIRKGPTFGADLANALENDFLI